MKNLLLVTLYSLLVLVLSGSTGVEAKKINPHREQKYCLECHTKKGYGELKKTILQLCGRCHQEIVKGGYHPLDGLHYSVLSSKEDLPLKEGKIVCTTCHEPHGKTEHSGLLRKNTNDLCFSCHLK